MKRKLLCLLISVTVLMLSGCTSLSEIKKLDGDTIVSDCAKEVAELINQRDTDGLIAKFCTYTQENCELEAEINEMYERFDGKIVSYDDYIPVGGGYSMRDGKIKRRSYSPTLRNVRFENMNDSFEIYISMEDIDTEYPEREGIWQIFIRKVDDEGHVSSDDQFVIGVSCIDDNK